MPLTFFAHQGPFLPIARRWPQAVDGVALGLGAATLWVALDRVDLAIAVLRLSFGLFGGMLAGCLAVRARLLRGSDDRVRPRADARYAP